LLHPLLQHLRAAGYPALSDTGWKPWDLAIDGHPWAYIPIEVVLENHGGTKRLARIRISWHFTPLSRGVLWVGAGLLGLGVLEAQPWLVGTAGVILPVGVLQVAYQSASVIQQACRVVKDVAAQLGLIPLLARNGRRA